MTGKGKQTIRKHMVIPILGIPVAENMREAALLVFGPEPPAIQEFIDNVLQILCDQIDREMVAGGGK